MPDNPSKRRASVFGNLLSDLPAKGAGEHFAEICRLGGGAVRIERIVSHGHASPEGFWYDQDEDEWVLILQGEARLRIEGREQPITLQPGDSLLLPAHCRHRIDWTTPGQPTVWLAVFPAT